MLGKNGCTWWSRRTKLRRSIGQGRGGECAIRVKKVKPNIHIKGAELRLAKEYSDLLVVQ